MIQIRRCRPGDEARAYEVCLRTGDAGADATARHDDPDLLGHVYVGPYLALAPQFSFMLVDESVVGYAVGTPDTAGFAAACERAWWPPLRRRYPLDGRRESDEELVRLIHQPPSIPSDEFLARYPAHLHINLLPQAQAAGRGRALLERLLGAFAEAGAPGVHLGVAETNARAIGFYERLGFTTVGARFGGRLMVRRT